MNDRRFAGDIERLRDPERVARMEIDRVVDRTLDGIYAQSMLDIGTGSGLWAEAFAAKGLRVGGVDVRPDMLEAAQVYVPSGEFKVSHMETLPYADGAFDIVFMGHVLHEADDLLKALGEALRVSTLRVAVLEWPYVEQSFGPPLSHRLKTDDVLNLSRRAGAAAVAHSRLAHMDLYLLDKRNLNPFCI
jgi:ubiquinone/menaquinone biosynthesis C-methylase UbiE